MFFALVTYSCNHHSSTQISFYYWRSAIALNKNEQKVLIDNGVKKIYIRYFDVSLNDMNEPIPETPIKGDAKFENTEIVPVVYIKNNVFEKADSNRLKELPTNIFSLIEHIDQQFGTHPHEIQFDCDWTMGTKGKFFDFLKQFKAKYSYKLSATIRLHQFKYPNQTGIPPVDEGVLMYYNMGKIEADSLNSVYERQIALHYLENARPYPLTLNVALPIFGWGVRIRDGKVIQLLSKLSDRELENNNHFNKLQKNQYKVIESCFFKGFYFKQGDIIKIETIQEDQLLEMAKDLKKHLNKSFKEVIFFDLDTVNTNRYDKEIFKKVADRIG